MNIKLSNKLLTLFIAVSILPLAIVEWAAYHKVTDTIQSLQYEKLSALAEERARTAESMFLERTHDAKVLAQSPVIKELLTRFSNAFTSGGIDSPAYKQMDRERGNYLKSYAEELSIFDILLITSNGDIVFSTVQHDELGANLRAKSYKESSLNQTFEDALSGNVSKYVAAEVHQSLENPAIFIAAPILSTNGTAGVLVFEIPTKEVYSFAQDYTGLGNTGETVLGTLRGDQIVMVTPTRHDPEAALQQTVMLGSEHAKPIQKATTGNTGTGEFTDYRGINVLAAWRHLPSMDLGMVMKIDSSEAFAPIYELRKGFALLGLFTLLIVIAVSFFIARTVSAPIVAITDATTRMADGDMGVRTIVKSSGEIGVLAAAFNHMADRLSIAREESKDDDWLKTGMAGLDDKMRGTKDLAVLCEDILAYIARYLDVQVGTLSLASLDHSRLKLTASYAFKRNQGTAKEFQFGDGLAGQAAQEKKQILVCNVKESHLTIRSALGKIVPDSILCSPLLFEGEVNGVIELGSLHTFTDLQLDFLNQTAERIAIAIHAAQTREKMKALLEGSQAQSEELQTQQEELRAANDTLQETNLQLEEFKEDSASRKRNGER